LDLTVSRLFISKHGKHLLQLRGNLQNLQSPSGSLDNHIGLGNYLGPLPSLFGLKFSFCPGTYDHVSPPFLSHITLPYLAFLDLCSMAVGPLHTFSLSRECETYLLDFIHRSTCPLTSLSLRHSLLSAEQTIQVLQILPNLAILYIHEYKNLGIANIICNERLFKHLLLDPATSPSRPFLPRLAKLKLCVCGEPLVHMLFARAIRSR